MPDRQRTLELALKGLEAEKTTIDDEIAEIKSQLNPRSAVAKSMVTASPTTPPRKKTMSAAARKKISEAMKRRHADRKKAGAPGHVPSQVRKSAVVGAKQSAVKKQNGGNRLTAAGRKKLSDLMTKRWADKRRGKAK
jgi:hypothetical protein